RPAAEATQQGRGRAPLTRRRGGVGRTGWRQPARGPRKARGVPAPGAARRRASSRGSRGRCGTPGCRRLGTRPNTDVDHAVRLMSKGRRRRGHDAAHENHERWLLTYADLITLLMVFFVVLYSMSSADSTKWKQISAALTQAFNVDVLQGTTTTTVVDGPAQPVPPMDNLIADSEVPQVSRLQNKP